MVHDLILFVVCIAPPGQGRLTAIMAPNGTDRTEKTGSWSQLCNGNLQDQPIQVEHYRSYNINVCSYNVLYIGRT